MRNVFFIKDFHKAVNSNNQIIFICDHATNIIPKKFKNLGLEKKFMESHIAFDIGAKELTVRLAEKLGQTCFLSNFSRLVIDPNRNLNDSGLIVPISFGIKIPGNLNIDDKQRNFRVKNFYEPYHSNLLRLLSSKTKLFKKIFVVSIHSFTKKSNQFNRGYEIGLLWNKNMNLLLPIQEKLREFKIHFGRNYPYSGFFFNHTLDNLNKSQLIDNISIEVRNDLICSKKGITRYVDIFSNIFKEILNDR